MSNVVYRRPFIERSLKSYAKQTYVAKELVIVLDNPSLEEELAMRTLVSRFPEESIRCFSVRPKRSLGALRNVGLDLSLGELICQWDDDFSHSDQLEYEARHLLERGPAPFKYEMPLEIVNGRTPITWRRELI